MQRPVIYLYTDGAASGNPGPGGYGVVLKCAGLTREISGGFRLTTNNRMELLAVIVGLEAIRWDNAEVESSNCTPCCCSSCNQSKEKLI